MRHYTFFTTLIAIICTFATAQAQPIKKATSIRPKQAAVPIQGHQPKAGYATTSKSNLNLNAASTVQSKTKTQIFTEVAQKGTCIIDKEHKPSDLILGPAVASVITLNKGIVDVVPMTGIPGYQTSPSPNEASEAEKQAFLALIEPLYNSYKQNEQVQYYLDEDAFTPLRTWKNTGIWATREQIAIATDVLNKINLSLKRNLDKNNINTVLDRWNALTQRSGIKPKTPLTLYSIVSATSVRVTPYARDMYGTPLDNALMYLTPVNQMSGCSPCIDCTFDAVNCDLYSIQNTTDLTLVSANATNITPGKYHVFITQENNGIESVVGYARRNISQGGQLTITAQ